MNIDVHSHAIPADIIELYRSEPAKYGLSVSEEPGREKSLIMNNGHVFPLLDQFHDVKTRLADMDSRGVDVELVTPAPTIVFYDQPIKEALPLFQKINDALAAMCAKEPKRLIACGTLPLQDVAASCAEVQRLVERYGTRMIMVNTHVNGRYYDEPEFLPLFEVCERLDVILFFHPLNGNTSYGLGPYYLTNLLGNAIDTTISATRLTLGGALKKYPGCKCMFAHGGGFLPYQRGRVQHGYNMREESKVGLGGTPPAEIFDRLYFDTITHGDPALEFLISSHGADRIMLGSDYPFDMADIRHPDKVLNLPGLSSSDKEKVLSQNILRLLGKK